MYVHFFPGSLINLCYLYLLSRSVSQPLYLFIPNLNLCKVTVKKSSNDVDNLKQEHQAVNNMEKQDEQHIMSNSNGEKQEEQQHHIMTVVNSQFETMPLGLSQDIPDVRL